MTLKLEIDADHTYLGDLFLDFWINLDNIFISFGVHEVIKCKAPSVSLSSF